MAKIVKLGFIGCGGMANIHASNIGKLENAKVIAWCDIVKERANGFLNKYGGKYTTDNMQDILNDSDIDGVFIVTSRNDDPGYLHAEVGVKAAEAGKHIFVEKPIANTLEAADKLVEAVSKSGIKFQHGFCFQYSPTTDMAKKLMPNPAYSVCQCAATLSGQVCHNLDILVNKLHDAKLVSVYASGGKYFDFDKQLPIDSFAAVLKFADGSTSSYVQHGTMNNSLQKFQIQLFGPEGCVFLGDRFRDVVWHPADGTVTKPYRDEIMYMGHFQEVEDFVNCIIENRDPINTAEKGRYVLAIEKAIIESAVMGKVIDSF